VVRARWLLHGAAALILMAGLTAAPQKPSPPADEHAALPAGPGRELVIRVCSSCHLAEVVADQELDPEGWKDLVNEMAGIGAVATDEEFDQIVRYLAKAFPVTK
jgi:mono/diheme cytochrome c family protein